MKTKAVLLIILTVTLVVASGCQGYESPTTPLASPGADEVGPPSVTPVTATPTALIPSRDDRERIEVIRRMVSPERAITSAREDLARRLGIPVGEVAVVSVVGDEFPASNLGCPCPKCPELPLPAIVTGQRITLAAQGKHYEYRARGSTVVFCGEL